MVPVSSSLPVHDKGRKVGVTPYAEDAIPEVLDCLKKSDFQMPAPSAPTDVHWLPPGQKPHGVSDNISKDVKPLLSSIYADFNSLLCSLVHPSTACAPIYHFILLPEVFLIVKFCLWVISWYYQASGRTTIRKRSTHIK